ncbi:MAG: metallophosphoesterase [Nitrospirae bacterium]|nr:metallophosphoesterase [Nitrospirota bacterium]
MKEQQERTSSPPVRFVAFTDHHASVESIQKVLRLTRESRASFIVCAGDFTIESEGLHPSFKMLSEAGIPIYFIAGNHEYGTICSAVSKAFPVLRYVDLKVDVFGAAEGTRVLIAGLDGTTDLSPLFGEDQECYGSYLPTLKAQVDPALPVIFLTHFPPSDTACCGLEPIWTGSLWTVPKDGKRIGSKAVRRIVESLKPRIVICGHFHECFGREDSIGSTRIVNPGPDGMVIELSIPSR